MPVQCRCEVSPVGDTERAFQIVIQFKTFSGFFGPRGADFGAFWANHLKSRLKFNNVPVHKTHSVTVRNREKTFKTLAIADPHKCESTQHNKLLGTFTCSNASTGQSARIAYLSWKIEIGRDWYRSQNGRDLGAKVKKCTAVHGLYV